MSIAPDTTLELIEHLDFDPELPCEHSSHQDTPHPADLLVRRTRWCCDGSVRVFGICKSMWAGPLLRCRACGHIGPRDAYWQIIEVLR